MNDMLSQPISKEEFFSKQQRPGVRYDAYFPGSLNDLWTLLRNKEKGVLAREVVKELQFLGGMDSGSQMRYLQAAYGVYAKDFVSMFTTLSDYIDPSEANNVILLQKHNMLVTTGPALKQLSHKLEHIYDPRQRLHLRKRKTKKEMSEGVTLPLVCIPLLNFPEKKKEYPDSPLFLKLSNADSFGLINYRKLTPSVFFNTVERVKLERSLREDIRTQLITVPVKKPAGRPSVEYYTDVALHGEPTETLEQKIPIKVEEFKKRVIEVNLGFSGLIGFLHMCFATCTDQPQNCSILDYSIKALYEMEFNSALISSIYAKHRARSRSGLAFSAECNLRDVDFEDMMTSDPKRFYAYMSRYAVILHVVADSAVSQPCWCAINTETKKIKRKYHIYCWHIFKDAYKHLCQFSTEHYCMLAAFHPYYLDAGTLMKEPQARFYFNTAELRYLCTACDYTPAPKAKIKKKRVFDKQAMRIRTVEEEQLKDIGRGYFNNYDAADYLDDSTSSHWGRGYLEYLYSTYNRDLTPKDKSQIDKRFTVKTLDAKQIYEDFCAMFEWPKSWKNTFQYWMESPSSKKEHFGAINLKEFAVLTPEDQHLLGILFNEYMTTKKG